MIFLPIKTPVSSFFLKCNLNAITGKEAYNNYNYNKLGPSYFHLSKNILTLPPCIIVCIWGSRYINGGGTNTLVPGVGEAQRKYCGPYQKVLYMVTRMVRINIPSTVIGNKSTVVCSDMTRGDESTLHTVNAMKGPTTSNRTESYYN
jgi:hypothetical protein